MSERRSDPAPRRLEERVVEEQAGAAHLLVLPAPVPSVVALRGSFRTRPDHATLDPLLQEIATWLLDKGTRRRDRFEIAEELENRGALLRFHSDGLRVDFSGRALREDLPVVLDVLSEQLREPLFHEEEFAKAQAQLRAHLKRLLENTGELASGALSRALYRPEHPNYDRPPEEELRRLADVSVEDVRRYHAEHFGAEELHVVLVGEVDPGDASDAVRRTLGGWSARAPATGLAAGTLPPRPGRSRIPVPDKSNVDVRIGHALALLRQDPDYVPLYVGNFILGGNFSARLMSTIRDEMGLTYGIGSGLVGVTTDHPGHWQVSVTLSQDALDRGIEATLAELRRFVEGGVTTEEVAEKQTTITGTYRVGLGTTGGLAATLLANAERGFGVDYLDRYPAEIEAVTVDAVNEAVRRHLHPDRLHVAAAGTFPEGSAAS